jgi:hypothetical protein
VDISFGFLIAGYVYLEFFERFAIGHSVWPTGKDLSGFAEAGLERHFGFTDIWAVFLGMAGTLGPWYGVLEG